MAKRESVQPLRMKPLTGSFDSRSLPELLAPDAWRLLQNTRTNARGRLCRMPGWEKFMAGLVPSDRPYHNEDLHDQLLTLQTYYEKVAEDDSSVLSYPPNNADFATYCGTTKKTRPQGRQPITFGAEITSSVGTRHCVVGTQSRLYALNYGTGNWKIIADGKGGASSNPEIRFQHASLGDYVFFTNDVDEVFYWIINAPTTGCEMQSVQTIPELREIGVSRVKCLASFKGTLFLANVEQDGQRYGNRIIWSRYQSPTEYVEDPGVSTAGTQDLDFGENILAMRELGDFLYIYTDRAIWAAVLTGDESVFTFVRKYRASAKGDGTLVYPNTLCGSKNAHYYVSTDGIYEWNPYIMAPVRQEWIHQSSNIILDNMNRSVCAVHTAGYWPETNEMWFSVAQGNSKLPSVTLTANATYGQCSKVDHGFTCFFAFSPDTRESVRDWLLRNCIADESCLEDPDILALGFSEPKEGAAPALTSAPCTDLVKHVHTDQALTVGDVTMEDYNQAESSPDSLCAKFAGLTLADGCQNCEAAPLFVAASATDWCLKQIGTIYARERYSDGVGWVLDGYETIMLKGPLMFGNDRKKMLVNDADGGGSVKLEFEAEPQTIPTNIKLFVGCANRCIDPLTTQACGINWYEEEARPLVCKDDDHALEWSASGVDKVLYLDFRIAGTGGSACFSSLQVIVADGGA